MKIENSLNVNVIFMNLLYLLYEEFFMRNVHDVAHIYQMDVIYIINGQLNFKKKKNL